MDKSIYGQRYPCAKVPLDYWGIKLNQETKYLLWLNICSCNITAILVITDRYGENIKRQAGAELGQAHGKLKLFWPSLNPCSFLFTNMNISRLESKNFILERLYPLSNVEFSKSPKNWLWKKFCVQRKCWVRKNLGSQNFLGQNSCGP